MPFDRDQIKKKAAALAAKDVFVGTSSWKYQSWLNQLYTSPRYFKQPKAAKDAGQGWFAGLDIEPAPNRPQKVDRDLFEANCLAEYAEVFKTVCVDAAYYTFPKEENLRTLADQVPDDFRFGLNVTEAITIKDYPNQPKHGAKAGQRNANFLDAELFIEAFLKPCEAIRFKVGVLIFEFSRFWPNSYTHGRDFIANLDAFLTKIPQGWPYAVELRNERWLAPDYFGCLANHNVTHLFNSWEAMPPVSEQLALPGSVTNPALMAARFLLKRGRKYAAAVQAFEPYDRTQEVNEEARKAIATLIKVALAATGGNLIRVLIYINNRLEGNALSTIAAVLESDDWR